MRGLAFVDVLRSPEFPLGAFFDRGGRIPPLCSSHPLEASPDGERANRHRRQGLRCRNSEIGAHILEGKVFEMIRETIIDPGKLRGCLMVIERTTKVMALLSVLQQLHIQVSFRRPSGARDVAQPGCREVKGRRGWSRQIAPA